MKAIVDCNSFYCSCEKVFRPDLQNKPVVVLSNNDGCIIALSDEAKQLGVAMAAPYFMNKEIIEKNNVTVFSSNYNLYGDMSWRVMETLRSIVGKDNVEVYSVDEAFLNLDYIPKEKLQELSIHIKETVEQWTGIKVSVGVAPTKVLSKVANRLAKKNKAATGCVLVLDTRFKIEAALKRMAVEDVWGVGFQYARKLKQMNINNAFELSIKSFDWARKNLGGVVGQRLLRELKGEPSIDMKEELVTKKMIATTRMFGSPVTAIQDIKEAIATYTSRSAEKLRRQSCAAKTISVFIISKTEEKNDGNRYRHGASTSKYIHLPIATSITGDLIKPAVQLVDSLYTQGKIYKKAGVILSNIVPDNSIQGNLFDTKNKNRERLLMSMMDNINFSMRNDILKFAASGTTRNWKMQQNFHSPRYTTRWNEICEIKK
jgi:DNA polymerase V